MVIAPGTAATGFGFPCKPKMAPQRSNPKLLLGIANGNIVHIHKGFPLRQCEPLVD
jgi:hypothetical protein